MRIKKKKKKNITLYSDNQGASNECDDSWACQKIFWIKFLAHRYSMF